MDPPPLPRRAPLLIPIAIALLVAAVLLILRTGSGDAPDAAARTPALSPAAGALADEAEPGADALRRSATAIGVSEGANPSEPPSSAPGAGVRLRVLRFEDASPVPGAEVHWYRSQEDGMHPRAREFLEDEYDRDAFARLLCPDPLRTDEQGFVTLPVEAGVGVWAVARGDGRRGVASFTPSPLRDEERLFMRTASELAIQVVDEAGHPVPGARVGWEMDMMGEPKAPTLWQWMITDREGMAWIRNLTPEQLGEPAPKGIHRWVALLEPFEPRIRVRWEFERPPPQPVVLRMPRHGSVLVTAEDAAGDPASDGTQVFLQDSAWGWRPGARGHGRLFRDGRCEFPFVGLGMALAASADLEERDRFVTVRGAGPSAAGERVALHLEPEAPGQSLTGRILLGDGAPAARDWTLSLMIVLADGENRGSYGGTVRLRADGGFRIAVRREWLQHAGRALLVLAPRGSMRGEQSVACAELAWPPEAGATDLGELPFGRELLVAGRVVDAWGSPAPTVHLEVCRTAQGENDQPVARDLAGYRLTPDPAGRFRFLGNWPPEADRIRFELAGRWHSSPAFRRGEPELLLVLPAQAIVRGRLLTDAPRPLRQELAIRARLLDAAEESVPGTEFDGYLRDDGAFLLHGLPAGRFAIELRGWAPSFSIPDLAFLTAGSRAEEAPPELNPLDLRGRLHFCSVSVRTSDGGPLTSAAFSFGGESEQASSRSFLIPALFAMPIGYRGAAECWTDGYAKSPVDLTLAAQEIVLLPLPRIRFRVRGIPFPSDLYNSVDVQLLAQDAAGTVSWSRYYSCANGGEAVAWVPEPGDYLVRLLIQQLVPGGSAGTAVVRLDGTVERRLAVPAEGLEDVVILEVAPEALAAACQALRKE